MIAVTNGLAPVLLQVKYQGPVCSCIGRLIDLPLYLCWNLGVPSVSGIVETKEFE